MGQQRAHGGHIFGGTYRETTAAERLVVMVKIPSRGPVRSGGAIPPFLEAELGLVN
jgi:hypothetical protein